jgi:hypothetical protein
MQQVTRNTQKLTQPFLAQQDGGERWRVDVSNTTET